MTPRRAVFTVLCMNLPTCAEKPAMPQPSNAVYAWVAAFSLVMAACQPAERAGKNLDNAAQKIGDQVDKASDKAKGAVNDGEK